MSRAENRRDGHVNSAKRSYLRAFMRWWRGAGAHIRNVYTASKAFEKTWPRRAPIAHGDVKAALLKLATEAG